MNVWKEMLSNPRATAGKFADASPKVVTAHRQLNGALGGNNALDAKTRELIALAVAVITRCDGCISSQAAAAREAGATKAEVAEALGTAVALNAGAAFVYSACALEAFEQFSPEGSAA